ncbi:hypothetical protein P3T73_10995 [Kiritimatiellota bacterium B12222]|nr:hypothetical protein P3T73_10995 [Kiritimatiellota bacterium B12222]
MSLFRPLLAEQEGELILKEGSHFQGKITAISTESLRFSSYWMENAVEIPLDHLSKYHNAIEMVNVQKEGLLVELHNGDVLWSKTIELTPQGFSLEPVWGHPVVLPRAGVKSLLYLSNQNVLYDGPPTGEGDLFRGGNAWSSEAVIIPEKFRLETMIKTGSGKEGIQVTLFQNRRDAQQRNQRLVLEFSGNHISCAWFEEEKENRFRVKNWRKDFPDRPLNLNVRLFGDQIKKEFQLYINGELFHEWRYGGLDKDDDISAPMQIRFHNGVGVVNVVSLRLFQWDGEGINEEQDTVAVDDNILLDDGRRFSGTLQHLNRGTLVFKENSSSELMTFEEENISEIHLPTKDAKDVTTEPINTVLVETQNIIDRLHLQVDRVEADKLYGRGVSAGIHYEIELPVKAIRSLSFEETTP